MKIYAVLFAACVAALASVTAAQPLSLTPLGTVKSGPFRADDLRVAEINAYDAATNRINEMGAPAAVRHVGFEGFDAPQHRTALEASGVRIFGPNASVSQDLEPEYIATAKNKAYVTLQENNALAIINIEGGTVEKIASKRFAWATRPTCSTRWRFRTRRHSSCPRTLAV